MAGTTVNLVASHFRPAALYSYALKEQSRKVASWVGGALTAWLGRAKQRGVWRSHAAA